MKPVQATEPEYHTDAETMAFLSAVDAGDLVGCRAYLEDHPDLRLEARCEEIRRAAVHGMAGVMSLLLPRVEHPERLTSPLAGAARHGHNATVLVMLSFVPMDVSCHHALVQALLYRHDAVAQTLAARASIDTTIEKVLQEMSYAGPHNHEGQPSTFDIAWAVDQLAPLLTDEQISTAIQRCPLLTEKPEQHPQTTAWIEKKNLQKIVGSAGKMGLKKKL